MGFNRRRREISKPSVPIGKGYIALEALQSMTLDNLRKLAKDLGVANYSKITKDSLAETLSKIPVEINKER
jgi:hypothetical protein